MKKNNKYQNSTILIIVIITIFNVFALKEREEFSIPLATVVAYFDRNTNKLTEVLIKYRDEMEGWTVSFGDDRYIKDSRNKTKEHRHIERPASATSLSPFEAEQIARVLETLEKTLEGLESDLEKKHWAKCRYLDGQMGLFLHSFYHLIAAATASYENMSPKAEVPKNLFEDSFYSELSDKRVEKWESNSEHALKLRISIRELVFQSKKWREEHLEDAVLNVDKRSMINFVKAYTLFIELYFNK